MYNQVRLLFNKNTKNLTFPMFFSSCTTNKDFANLQERLGGWGV
jgi:hypothetical protein